MLDAMSSAECNGLSVFLNDLFECLNKYKIKYAILRNYNGLPNTAGDSDLDILIPSSEENNFKEILFGSVERCGGVKIGFLYSIGYFQIHALGYTKISESKWWGLRLDIYIGLFYKGNRIADIDFANDIKKQNEICVLKEGLAGAYGVLKNVLSCGNISKRYLYDAIIEVKHNGENVDRVLRFLGPGGLGIFKKMILSENNSTLDYSQVVALRRRIFWQSFKSSPTTCISGRLSSEWSKVRRFLRPSGVVVAILGVDGVGKSTVIKSIAPVLKEATHGAFSIGHLRPGLLPPLARFKGIKTTQVGIVQDPHGSTPSGKLGSIIRLLYFAVDYVVGYWILLRPRIAKCPAVLLFDRYFYDIAIDPLRFRIGILGRKLVWFLRLLPKPDIVLCLHASPHVIASRKQELTLDEITRQVEALRELAHREPRAILISTEGSVEEVRDRVLMTLKDFFARRKGSGC
jgi:thymidylate kinase